MSSIKAFLASRILQDDEDAPRDYLLLLGSLIAVIASAAALRIGRNEAAGAYFDGYMDEVAVHKVPLGAEAVLDHYKAGAVTLKFQARSSTNETFSTAFIGPDRTTNTYFLLQSGSDMTTSIDPGLFYQYRVVMNSEDARFPPELRGVTVLVSGYPISNPTIVPTISVLAVGFGSILSSAVFVESVRYYYYMLHGFIALSPPEMKDLAPFFSSAALSPESIE